MLYINVNLRHPGWWQRFRNIKSWGGDTPFKHKYWSVEIIENDNVFRFELSATTRQDHAGVQLELGLLGYEIHLAFCDSRHWDYEKNSWVVYNDV